MVHKKKMKSIRMDDLFNDSEMTEITRMINQDDWKTLKIYLRSKEKKLKDKGVLPDYLYYYLEYSSKR